MGDPVGGGRRRDSLGATSLATMWRARRLVSRRQAGEPDQAEMDHRPEDGEQDRADPGGGEELLLELRVHRRARVPAVAPVDPRLVMALHAQRQHGEQHRPPDGQEDRDRRDRAHQWAPFGVSISSTRTPPMFLGWTKITGTLWAPMRGTPLFSTVAPLATMSSRAAMMSGTSKQT